MPRAQDAQERPLAGRSARMKLALHTRASPYSHKHAHVLSHCQALPDNDLLSHGETPHYHRR